MERHAYIPFDIADWYMADRVMYLGRLAGPSENLIEISSSHSLSFKRSLHAHNHRFNAK